MTTQSPWQSEYQRAFGSISPPKVKIIKQDPKAAIVPDSLQEQDEDIDYVQDENKQPKKSSIQKVPLNVMNFGTANTSPANQENYMKTFNVTVPPSQIMPFTQERVARIKDFRAANNTSNKHVKKYVEALQILDKLSNRYQSEYSRNFVDWSSNKIAELDKKTRKIDEQASNEPVISSRKEKSVSFKDVQISDEAIQTTPTEHSTESIQTSPTIPEPIQTLSTIPITNSDVIQDSIVSTTVDETQAPSIETFPTAFFNFQNVSPAGISASQSYKEKRHYSVKKDQIQLQLDDLENDMKVGNEKLSSYSDGFLSSVRKSSNRKDPTFKMAKWILEHVKAKK